MAETQQIKRSSKRTATVRMRTKGELTLPPAIRRAARLGEGEDVELRVVEGGVLIRSTKRIDPKQSWYWAEQWQKGECEASDHLRKGRTKKHKDLDAFFRHLDRIRG